MEFPPTVLGYHFEMYYSLYMDAIDDLIINTIYKKVRNNVASEFEKEAMGRYYNIIHLKKMMILNLN